eukprot:CAMPEP_0114494594 /NCGR_PEP_ID=MMETSP0109-20121206/4738_1 /TAXON_ID=29199 /ORGANISM="Chlorarachnion reptans, Strain CCCM449" /LENGTH=90 /DNA_ID=CAMNT_0001671647 /DNA_START=36 /DNA_END=308 /DNA_ORIENTATION=+
MKELWPQIFAAFDVNGDGKVSRKELLKFWKIGGDIAAVLAKADFDKDGIVSAEEWTKQYDVIVEKFGTPDRGAVREAEACLERLTKAKKA